MSDINKQGQALWAREKEKLDAGVVKNIEEGIVFLESEDFKITPLTKGESAPTFELQSHTGERLKGAELYAASTVVLFFYRGQWCPFCNLQLKAYMDQIQAFQAKNARLIAVSPELPDYSKQAVEENGVEFDVLFDKDNGLAKQFGVAADVPEAHVAALSHFDLALTERHGSTQWELPIPGVFIIKQGIVSDVLIDVNYRKRPEVEDILPLL